MINKHRKLRLVNIFQAQEMLQLVRRRVFKWTHSPLKLIHGYTNFRAASIPTNHNEEMVEQSKTKQSVNTLFQQPLRNKIIASLQNLKKSYSSIFKTLMIACDDPEIREILIKSIPILEKIYVKWNTTRKDNIELDNLRNKLPDTLIVEALISLNVFSSLKSHAFDLLSRTKNPRFVLSIAILAYHCNAVTLNTSSTSSSHISKSILQFTDEESKRLIQALIENNSKPSTVVSL